MRCRSGWDFWVQLLHLAKVEQYLEIPLDYIVRTLHLVCANIMTKKLLPTPFFFAGRGLGTGFVLPSYRFIQMLWKKYENQNDVFF